MSPVIIVHEERPDPACPQCRGTGRKPVTSVNWKLTCPMIEISSAKCDCVIQLAIVTKLLCVGAVAKEFEAQVKPSKQEQDNGQA